MAKYRFKTEAEFKAEDMWYDGCPECWNSEMNKYLGTDVPDEFNSNIEREKSFRMYDEEEGSTWTYQPEEVVLKSSVSSFIIHPVKEFKF